MNFASFTKIILWATTLKMEEYLSPISGKRKKKLLSEFEKKKSAKLRKLSKITI